MHDIEQYKFLNKIVDNILQNEKLFYNLTIVTPNKCFGTYIKKVFANKGYQGILPKFQTLEELVSEISKLSELSGVSLWIFSYKIYQKLYPLESFKSFLGWFLVFLNDWDEILKSDNDDIDVIDFMLSDERIKNFGDLYDKNDKIIGVNIDFWQKMKIFLPTLKEKLLSENLGTKGIIYQIAKKNIEYFSEETDTRFIFCLFNNLNIIEKYLIKNILKQNKSTCFFRADEYYINDEVQEAGRFIRNYTKWIELSEDKKFNWIDDNFIKEKNIHVFEVAGNITQTKILPNILTEIKNISSSFENTAIILLDENLIFPVIDSVNSCVGNLDVDLDVPLKNTRFIAFIMKIIHLQKQIYNNPNLYYHQDLVNILDDLYFIEEDFSIKYEFIEHIKERNIVYIPKKLVEEFLGKLSYFELLVLHDDIQNYLDVLINFCMNVKCRKEIYDIEHENISNIEDIFIDLKRQLENYDFSVNIDILEILLNKSVSMKNLNLKMNSENGIKIMKLSDARVLNFENIIMLSVNEGKLPIGKTQNTFLSTSIRRKFELNTFLENDSIDAYNFYSLIQEAKNIYLLFNGIPGISNTGEKSRFITQIELESSHRIQNFIVDSSSEPIEKKTIEIKKTYDVLGKLNVWKQKITPSHINSYLYDPVSFCIEKILNIEKHDELEEELSSINFGNLVHNTLEYLYRDFINERITVEKLSKIQNKVENTLEYVITEKLNHYLNYYEKGINYIHKEIALRTVKNIIQKDLNDIKKGNVIEILALEKRVSADFYLDDENKEKKINLYGIIDRIDRFNENIRIIDYKTSKESDLNIKSENMILFDSKYRQELQLSIYAYCLLNSKDFIENEFQCGIWSFINPINGAKILKILDQSLINKSNIEIPMKTVRDIILEILDPNIAFIKKE